MKSFHRDPTMDAAARNEAKDCAGCIYMAYLWGLSFCEKHKWSGIKNMKRCELWQWEDKSCRN